MRERRRGCERGHGLRDHATLGGGGARPDAGECEVRARLTAIRREAGGGDGALDPGGEGAEGLEVAADAEPGDASACGGAEAAGRGELEVDDDRRDGRGERGPQRREERAVDLAEEAHREVQAVGTDGSQQRASASVERGREGAEGARGLATPRVGDLDREEQSHGGGLREAEEAGGVAAEDGGAQLGVGERGLGSGAVCGLGAGGGADVLLALYHGAGAIDAVELNPQVVALVARDFADYAGNPYAAHGVRVHTAEARRFVARSAESYDVIQVALLDSFNASAAGVHALNESNLYTVEALEAFLAQLAPDGYLAITRWIKLPPRDALKLFATAVAALEGRGVARPAERLALIRSWKTATLLVKNGSMSATDIASITRFAEARGFDLAYAPGIQRSQVNRYNILERPYLFDGARALLGEDRGAFITDYKFDIAPATDDRPYFFHFFKWRPVPELLALGGRSGLPLVEWGYVVLIATLAQAALISAGLILLPLAVRRRQSPARGRARVFAYFLALGLGFLFIEMAFIQRMTLFLGHPLYAVAVVLGAFLVFAGLGSGYAARFAEHEAARARPPMALAAGAVALLAVLTLVLLPPLFDILQAAPASARIAVAIALIAPLAFCMGLPFPLGLARLAAYAPEWVPWAWGINGCASVLSAVLATLLAIHFGFTVVVGLAALLYALAAGLPPRAPRTAS